MAEYYGHYERFFGLDVRRPVTVAAVYDRGADLVVRTTVGEITSRVVVNATGTWGAPFVPYYPGMRDFVGRQVHTSSYRDAADFAGLRVLVVGGGTSAIGFLLELEGVAAKTYWATRRPVEYLEHGALDLEAAVTAVEQQDLAARTGRALPSIVLGHGGAPDAPHRLRDRAGGPRAAADVRPPGAGCGRLARRVAGADRRDRVGDRVPARHPAPEPPPPPREGRWRAGDERCGRPRSPHLLRRLRTHREHHGANRAGRTLARQVFAALGETSMPVEATPEIEPAVLQPPPPEDSQDHVAQLMARFFTDA